MSPIILYGMDRSPPTRAVKMLLKALDLKFEDKTTNLMTGDHLKPEYLKMNPLHTIPTLDDNGFIIYESHAILFYLANNYSKDLSLFPADIKKSTVIHQRLHFDTGYLFPRTISAGQSIMKQQSVDLPEEQLYPIKECYEYLEKFLEASSWIAGDFLSVADISIVATVSSVNILIPIDSNKYPKLSAWLEKMKQQSFYEANLKGLLEMEEFVSSLKK